MNFFFKILIFLTVSLSAYVKPIENKFIFTENKIFSKYMQGELEELILKNCNNSSERDLFFKCKAKFLGLQDLIILNNGFSKVVKFIVTEPMISVILKPELVSGEKKDKKYKENKYIIANNKKIISQSCFNQDIINSLPIVCAENKDLKYSCCLLKLPEIFFSKYNICWLNKNYIKFENKKDNRLIIISSRNLKNIKNLMDKFNLAKEIYKKNLNYKKIDLRFKDRLICSYKI